MIIDSKVDDNFDWDHWEQRGKKQRKLREVLSDDVRFVSSVVTHFMLPEFKRSNIGTMRVLMHAKEVITMEEADVLLAQGK